MRPCHPILTAALISTLALAAAAQEPGKAAPRIPEGVKVVRDLTYRTVGDRELKLDLYLPEKADGPVPLVVWVHGGAWLGGSKTGGPAIGLAARGFAVASVEYRFSPVARFPAQIEDCKAAVRWLRAHADEYRIDPKRVGAFGASAGGHLVALLGTAGDVKELEGDGPHADQSSRVQAVVDWFGPTDFTRMGGSHDNPDAPEARLIGGPVQEKKAEAARANPITYVTEDDPPFLIMHGEDDATVPIGQSELLEERLKKADVPVTFVRIPGAGHGGPGFNTPEVRKEVESFLRKHLELDADR